MDGQGLVVVILWAIATGVILWSMYHLGKMAFGSKDEKPDRAPNREEK